MAALTRLPLATVLATNLDAAPSFNTFVLDATTDQLEFMFQMPEDATITDLGVRVGVRTGTPPTYIGSLQSVGTDGNPSGTVLGGGSPASATFTPPADTSWNSTFQWVTLANSIAVTRGQFVAVVIAYSSGTVDASNNVTLTSTVTGPSARTGFPMAIQNNAGTRSRQATCPVFGLKSSTAVYGFPVQGFTATNYSSTDTPDEYGMLFTIPTGMCTTFQIVGARWAGNQAAAAKTVTLKLYDTDGTTVLQNMTYDADVMRSGGGSYARHEFYFDEATLSTLTPGSAYRVTVLPNEVAVNVSILTWDFAASNDLNALPFGATWYLVTRTDAGAWTETTTKRPVMEPILADMTVATPPIGQIVATRGNIGTY